MTQRDTSRAMFLRVETADAQSRPDIIRSLFGIAMALGGACFALQELFEVRAGPRLLYEAALLTLAVSVAASIFDAVRTQRPRSLYFGSVAVALYAFGLPRDEKITPFLGAVLVLLLGAVLFLESRAVFRSIRAAFDK